VMPVIRPRERDAILQSLRAGVVPRVGQHLIQVGRAHELRALLEDIERVSDGGATFRLIIGEYGAGKTFFLNLVRSIALEKKLVTMHADLDPDRRLHASGGQARSLYAELTRNMATRTKPEGGALAGILEKFIAQAKTESEQTGVSTDQIVRQNTQQLAEMVNGYDFGDVVLAYWRGFETDNEQLRLDAVRWMRGEFSTKTDARAALGVRTIVDDATVYDQLKLLAHFVRLAGYSGLFVCLDEMVNLYKLANTQARLSNYEQVLRILNDSLQGSTEGLGFILGGTPEFLFDTRRGLYSYAALQSRLAQNTFAREGLADFSGPVIRLSALTPEDFQILLEKLRYVYAQGDPARYLLPDEAIPAFMHHCSQRLGDNYFRTPRTTITSFIDLLTILDQNPQVQWTSLIDELALQPDTGGEADKAIEPDDEFTTFKL
jgi:P-loop Domain of unknown function (DUF2791)